MNWKEFHHLYWGVLLLSLAWLLRKKENRTWFYACLIVGVYMIADDLCQHTGGLHALFVYLWGLTGWPWPFNC